MVRLIGYWRSDDAPQWPDPHRFVDPGWDRAQREMVVRHLGAGSVVAVAVGLSSCRICGRPNGSAELTDGSYLWPEGLAHYVEEHAVRLPREFVDHAIGVAGDLTQLGEAALASGVEDEWWKTQESA